MNRLNFIPLMLLSVCLILVLITHQSGDAQAMQEETSGLKSDNTYYVATTGSNGDPGTLAEPWRTIQYAADQVVAGDTVLVRGGVYAEAITINVSGSAPGGYISFQSYPGETAVVDGSTLTVPAAEQALFHIDSHNYLEIVGFELRNYSTSNANRLPLGIFVTGSAHHIHLKNNHLHHIENNGGSNGNAHGIAIYGTDSGASINNLLIEGNELHSMKLGNSEALVLNGNVEDFAVINNLVYDVDNIGLDFIGFEGTATNVNVDQARDGIVKGNIVYDVDSSDNPAYFGERSAGGIYVDGGTRITIERNIVHHSNIGIELASEHPGKATSYITLQNNLIYLNHIAGLAMGGYNTNRGSTENCIVTNNTFYKNDSLQDGNGELYLQYDIKDSQIKNNIFVANSQNIFMTNDYTANTNNTVDHNLYYAASGAANGEWEWKTVWYTGFADYQSGSGNDANATFADPIFVSEATPDFHLQSGSPAIATAVAPPAPNEDFDGVSRPIGVGYDKGAYEYNAGLVPAYLPAVMVTAVAPNTVLLAWHNATQYNNYAIWRSTDPYFTPVTLVHATIHQAPWHYADTFGLGNVAENYFYIVTGQGHYSGTTYSKHVGEFDFALDSGS